MECPFCGVEYLEGTELCDGCGQDLTGVDEGTSGQGRLQSAVLGHLADVQLKDPLILSPDATVADAVAMMRERRHGSVQLVDGDEFVGIFTESDLLRRLDPKTNLAETALSEVMTREPESYTVKNTLASALNGMALRGFRHVPIRAKDGRLTGFLSVRGMLAHICDQVGL